jgi:hypothetical protein
VPITRLHYLFLAFDARGRFLQWTIIDHPNPKDMPVHELAAVWCKRLGGASNEH